MKTAPAVRDYETRPAPLRLGLRTGFDWAQDRRYAAQGGGWGGTHLIERRQKKKARAETLAFL